MLSAVGEGVQAFWQDRTLLDYTIEVEDEQFRVHKLIMASVSDYFKAMLTGGMVESQTDRVRLIGQNPHAVSNMIEFIYTGQFGASQVTTEELLACAMYLQIPPAIEVCSQQLCDKVNAQNAVDVLATFKAYNLEEGIKQVVNYIRSNMDEVLNVCKFKEMSPDKLGIVLDCWGKSECKLFLTIKEWIEVDFQNRNQHLNDLMSHVRFALMTLEQLEDVKDMGIYCDSDGSWCNLVAEADDYHKLPIHLKVLDESEQCTVRADPTPLCFMAEENSDGVFYAVEGTAWWQHKALNHPEVGFTVDASVVVNNFFIACKEQKLYVFDPRTKKWSSMTEMPVPKHGFCLVHCDKQLYIVGGEVTGTGEVSASTDRIERYDFETNTWSVITSKMPVVLEGFSACALDGFIYVAGGWQRIPRGQSSDRKDSTRMDCFDPTTNTWSSKAPVLESFQARCLQVMELCKEDVIFGMDRGFYMQYYSPSTDQWSAYDPLCGAHTNMVHSPINDVIPIRNTLYFIDFFHDVVYVRGKERDCWETDDGATPGACEVWTMREKGKKAIVKKLDNFPLDEINEVGDFTSYFLAVLALAP